MAFVITVELLFCCGCDAAWEDKQMSGGDTILTGVDSEDCHGRPSHRCCGWYWYERCYSPRTVTNGWLCVGGVVVEVNSPNEEVNSPNEEVNSPNEEVNSPNEEVNSTNKYQQILNILTLLVSQFRQAVFLYE